MAGISRNSEKKGISLSTLNDIIVFIYIIAIFVLENARFSQVFSIIQVVFLGFSILMLGQNVKVTFCFKWCLAVLSFAVVLAFINYSAETTSTLIIIIKNLLKCFFFFMYMRDEERIEKVIKYVGIAGVICGVYILSEFLASGMSYDNLEYATLNRIGADIAGGNVNIVGMNMCIAFASWLYLLGKTKKKWIKLIVFCAMAFVVVTSLLTGSRKILVFYVVTFVLANLQSSKRNLVFVIGGLIALYIAVMEIEPLYYLVGHKLDFFGGSSAHTMYQESDENRLMLMEKGLRLFVDRPWGIGFGSSSKYMGTYSHNNYIEVLVSSGLIGLIVYYASYFYSLYFCSRKRSSPLGRYVIYTTVGFLLIELGQVTYLYSVPMVFLALIMAVAEGRQNSDGVSN